MTTVTEPVKGPLITRTATCTYCGKGFTYQSRNQNAERDWCDTCAEPGLKAERRRKQILVDNTGRKEKIMPEQHCLGCGKRIFSKKPTRFCNKECKEVWKKNKKKAATHIVSERKEDSMTTQTEDKDVTQSVADKEPDTPISEVIADSIELLKDGASATWDDRAKDSPWIVWRKCERCHKWFPVGRPTRDGALKKEPICCVTCTNEISGGKRKEPKIKKCVTCGEDYVIKSEAQKFCSKECLANYREIAVCTDCGKEYEVGYSTVVTGNKYRRLCFDCRSKSKWRKTDNNNNKVAAVDSTDVSIDVIHRAVMHTLKQLSWANSGTPAELLDSVFKFMETLPTDKRFTIAVMGEEDFR